MARVENRKMIGELLFMYYQKMKIPVRLEHKGREKNKTSRKGVL